MKIGVLILLPIIFFSCFTVNKDYKIVKPEYNNVDTIFKNKIEKRDDFDFNKILKDSFYNIDSKKISIESYFDLYIKSGAYLDTFPSTNFLYDGEYKYNVIDTFSNLQERDEVLRNCIYHKHDTLLKVGLTSNEVPLFMYNECLDNDKFIYCFVSSNKSQSLRYDLLKNLPDQLIDKLLLLADIEKLNRKCFKNPSVLKYSEKSNLDLIEMIFNKRNKK